MIRRFQHFLYGHQWKTEYLKLVDPRGRYLAIAERKCVCGAERQEIIDRGCDLDFTWRDQAATLIDRAAGGGRVN